jgi:hypothetical protein
MKLASAILSFSLILLGVSEAATYYVAKTGSNSNSGTQSSPWQTISAAEGKAKAGDTVVVSAGTYSESITANGSGSAGSVITFQGSGNPIIAGTLLISGTYITFNGFTVSPPSVGRYTACDVEGSHNILSNTVVTKYGATASNQATAITTGGSFNTVDHCSVLNLNDIDAFHIWGHDITISNNTVSQVNLTNYAANHTDFLQTWGLQSSQIAYNIRIFGNLVENSTCDIGNTETDGNPNLHDWYIYNNIFYNIGSSFFSGLPNTWIYNNIFMLQGTGGGDVALMFFTDNAGTQSGGSTGYDYNSAGSRVENNAFIADSSDIGVGGNKGTLSTVTISNNYFTSNTAYAAERSPTGTAYVNGGNPNFTNAASLNFHINSGGVLIGKGANLSSLFKTDRDGNIRDAWDIGPYAYTASKPAPTPTPTPKSAPTPAPTPKSTTGVINLHTVANAWNIAGAGDFNRDGFADLVWENSSTGQRAIWFLKNGVLSSSIYLPTVALDWRIVGVGDFNGDGNNDLVLENRSTGQRAIWFLKNGVLSSSIYLPTLSVEWHIAGAGNFNGDGLADLVLENTSTGQRAIWFLKNGVLSSSIYLPTVATDWRIVGVGDFNGDGNDDLVWENTSTGQRAIWFLKNGVQASSISLPTVPVQWHIAGAADFNDDGYADVVWENSSTGQRAIWLLKNGVPTGGATLP